MQITSHALYLYLLTTFKLNFGSTNCAFIIQRPVTTAAVNFFKELNFLLSVTVSKFAEPIPNTLVQSWCGIISVYLNLGASRHNFLA